jgi:hypothetical protein
MDAYTTWPRTVRDITWPEGGVSYTYEHRGYIRPEKLEYWLTQLFGLGEAKYMVRRPQFSRLRRKGWIVGQLQRLCRTISSFELENNRSSLATRPFHSIAPSFCLPRIRAERPLILVDRSSIKGCTSSHPESQQQYVFHHGPDSIVSPPS